MEHTKNFRQKISPFDLGIEWFIKGANIGMIYGFCFLSEVEKGVSLTGTLKNKFGFVAKNTWQTGCVLGTWWFFMKSFEIIVGNEHWGNYSVSGVVTMLLCRKLLEIPSKHVIRNIPIAAAVSGGLGLIILGNS